MFKVICLFVLLSLQSYSYVGSKSGEATLRYVGTVEFSNPYSVDQDEIQEKIHRQVLHLFGPMARAQYPAVPKGDEKIWPFSDGQVQSIFKPYFTESGKMRVDYLFEGEIAVVNGPRSRYPVILALDPDTIYDASEVVEGNRSYYPCTDEYYSEEGDFWYFWSPTRDGCPLEAGKDYITALGELQRHAKSPTKYPEYGRLLYKGEVRIDVFFGISDPVDHPSRNPLLSKDINAWAYREVRKKLHETYGFSKPRRMPEVEIRAIAPRLLKDRIPYVEDFYRRIPNKKAVVHVRLFFGETGIDEKARGFHFFYKQALEEASIMVYSGHSGLGAHLDLELIERRIDTDIWPNQNRYQIYFFDSCTSYSYYTTQYFKRKRSRRDPKGTKNLDIWTNGLETPFNSAPRNTLKMIQVVIDAVYKYETKGTATSYQRIAKEIDDDVLFGINGEEDND